MMAVERQNADNEVVTITSIVYGGTLHGNSYWTAYAELYGEPLSIRMWPEDKKHFVDAGYPDMLQIHQKKSDLKIATLVKWDQKQGHRIREVYPASGIPAGGILDADARDRQWNADVKLCKTPIVIGTTARLYAIVDGKPVLITWEKKSDGTYERYQQGQGTQQYAAKAVIPEARIRALMTAVGIESADIRTIVECKSAWKRPGTKPSYSVVLTKAAGVSNAALKAAGAVDGLVNGNVIVVKLEEG